MALAMAPHAKRNDIATSLECREVLIDFVLMLAWAAAVARWRPAVRLHGSMMLPIGPRKQPAGAPCGRASHACERVIGDGDRLRPPPRTLSNWQVSLRLAKGPQIGGL